MTDDDRNRLNRLANYRIADLTLLDVAFLVRVLRDHEDEVRTLHPDLAALLDA